MQHMQNNNQTCEVCKTHYNTIAKYAKNMHKRKIICKHVLNFRYATHATRLKNYIYFDLNEAPFLSYSPIGNIYFQFTDFGKYVKQYAKNVKLHAKPYKI